MTDICDVKRQTLSFVDSSAKACPSRQSYAEPGIAESWFAALFVVKGPTSSESGKLRSNHTYRGLKRNGTPDHETALNCGGSFGWLVLAEVSALSLNGQHDEGGRKKPKTGSATRRRHAPSFA